MDETKEKPVRITDKGIVMLRGLAVAHHKDEMHKKFPHAKGGEYFESQLIPNPTDAEREFVKLGWAKEVK